MENAKRLVDANVVLAELDKFANPMPNKSGYDFLCGIASAITEIEDAPTVDAMEVVHAEWLDIVFDPMWRSMSATCSHCMVRGEVRVKSNECGFAGPDSDYCPHCGARMDLET